MHPQAEHTQMSQTLKCTCRCTVVSQSKQFPKDKENVRIVYQDPQHGNKQDGSWISKPKQTMLCSLSSDWMELDSGQQESCEEESPGAVLAWQTGPEDGCTVD